MKAMKHDWENEIKRADLRVTPARIATMQLFESHERPLDAQHLIEHLYKEIGVDRVTVFRILNAFVERRLIRKLTFGESKARYELNKKEHHHLICQHCGSIKDISDCNIAILEEEIKRKKKFLVQEHSLEFFGLCSNCQL